MVQENRLTPFLKKAGPGIASICIVILLWQIISDFLIRNSFLLPSFTRVAVSFYELRGEFPFDTLVSLLHFGMGLAAGSLVGIPLGAIIGWSKLAERILDPLIEIIRPIPPLSWIPFAIIWFGLAHFSAGFIVFIGMVFPILINTYSGFRDVRKVYVEAANVLGCTRNYDLIRSVAFPSATPSIATGIRIGMGIGWMCLVAAEIFGRSSGLGYKLWRFYELHQMSKVVAYMILLGVIGLLLDRIFRYVVERKRLRWWKGITV
jgi:NitT/TauT family transport system permease protein